MDESATDLALKTDELELSRESQTERLLLLIGGGFIAINFSALMLLRSSNNLIEWLPLLIWIGCAIGGHLLLHRYLANRDPLIFPLVMFLSGWGLVIIDRLAPRFADRQAIWLIVSVIMMFLTAEFPYLMRWLKRYRYTLLIGGLILLISTILFGTNPTGQETAPQLWLGFGGLFFQPSEALKVILVAFLASYLAEQYPLLRAEHLRDHRHLPLSPRIIGPMILMWLLAVIIAVWQRDLGTAVVFFMVFIILLYVASGYLWILVSGGFLTVLAAFAAYYLFSVVRLRIDIWINPWIEAEGRAYQIVQSLMAFAAGGIFGQGVGQGNPTFIPVVHSDFVFAALAEEWGLFGIIAMIFCFMLLIVRGFRVSALHQDRPFYALFAIGLSALLAIQSLLIMGGVLKLVPLTGVTLPYISYGGSSLLISFIIAGLLLRLSCGERS